MTFEERLAAQGRKMDELKAKLDEAMEDAKAARELRRDKVSADFDKLDSAVDKLAEEIDEKLYQQKNKLEAQLDKQFDTLDEMAQEQHEAKEAAVNFAKDAAEELVGKAKDGVEEVATAIDEKAYQQKNDIEAKLDDRFDKFLEKTEQEREAKASAVEAVKGFFADKIGKAKETFTLDKDTAEKIADVDTVIEKIQDATEDPRAVIRGEIAAAEENLFLAKGRNEAKRNAVMLRARMNVKNARDRVAAQIDAKKEALDKAAYEALIMDLLDYADGCQQLASAWALEAEYYTLDAMDVIDEYNEKFNK